MLQQDEPDDYILASGIGHTVAEFAERAFAHVGLGAGDHVRVDPSLRPAARADPAVGDPSRRAGAARLAADARLRAADPRMVDADLRRLRPPSRSDASRSLPGGRQSHDGRAE